MADIKPGDVVYLKSGGPAMTVVAMPNMGTALPCGWFVDDREYRQANIEPDGLTTTPPGKALAGKAAAP